MARLLCLAFFLSGAAGLLFESLWFYQAGLGLGNSIWASSLVLAAFMGGLGVGNGLVGRFGHRIRAPVRCYAVLEGVIALTGVALVYLLPALTPWLAPHLGNLEGGLPLNGLRLGVSFALLLVPSSAMGATMPLLVAALGRREARFGAVLGRLYGWNTLGAVAGALVGEVALIEWLGVRGSAHVAALGNVVAALLALAVSRRIDADAASVARRAPARLPARAHGLLFVAFLAGAVLLALEVVWFRFLLLHVTGTSVAFAAMLATVLAGIALGGLLAGRWLRSYAGAVDHLPALGAGAGALCVASYAGFGALAPSLEAGRPAFFPGEILALGAPLMLPVSMASGLLFTLLGEAIHRAAPGETRAAGFLTLSNTVGAMFGSLFAGFVLLPGLGVELSTFALAGCYAAMAVVLFALLPRPVGRGASLDRLATTAALLVALGLFPHGAMRDDHLQAPMRRWLPAWHAAEIREGLTETIVYLERELFGEPIAHRMLTNSHSMSSTSPRDARYMKLFVYWPVAVHPDPKHALLISYGVGVTAKALTDTPDFETIDFVDISRDVYEMNRHVYPDPAENPLNDPRVTAHVEDGRFFLQTTPRRFDVITGEPPPPKLAGVVTLYTREYFALMHDRLAEGGIATYWLPVHNLTEADARAILAAFCDVFADCSLWGGSGFDWMMVGTREARGPVSVARFDAQWNDPRVGPELRALGFERPETFGALFIEGRDALLERTRFDASLVDDRPKRLADLSHSEADRFLGWLDGARSRRLLRRDPGIARLWPRERIESAAPAFTDQVRFE
ncbi:MAG: fused MFS/spermidine synthase, partial [Myxococcota bacterium]